MARLNTKATVVHVAVMSRATLSQNTKLIIGNTVIKAVTKILCAELLQTVEKKKKKRTIWVRNWMQRKGATHTIFKELYNEDPLEYKAVMRMTPTQVEILLNLIAPKIQRGVVGECEQASKNKKCCSNWYASHWPYFRNLLRGLLNCWLNPTHTWLFLCYTDHLGFSVI